MRSDTGRAVVAWSGLVLLLAVGVFPYASSGLVAPPEGVLLLWALWVALLVVALRWRTRRPLWVPVIPVVGLGLWFAVISLGGALLGWTA